MKNKLYNPLDLHVVRFCRRAIVEGYDCDDCLGYFIAKKKVGMFKNRFVLLSKKVVVSELEVEGFGVTEDVPLMLVAKEGMPNKLSYKQILDIENSINDYYEANLEEIEGYLTEDEDAEDDNSCGDNDAEGYNEG